MDKKVENWIKEFSDKIRNKLGTNQNYIGDFMYVPTKKGMEEIAKQENDLYYPDTDLKDLWITPEETFTLLALNPEKTWNVCTPKGAKYHMPQNIKNGFIEYLREVTEKDLIKLGYWK